MPGMKMRRAAQAMLLGMLLVVNVLMTLKISPPPGIPCNPGIMHPSPLPMEPGMYRNPVAMPAGQDVADPAVVRHDGRYYMTGTGPGHYTGDIGMWSSLDLVNWTYEGIVYHAPRDAGDWNLYMFWAAELFVYGGAFYLSYSASPDQVMQHHRIGIARSTSMTGPYIDVKDEPIFDLHQETIDQHIVDLGGTPYMYYTNHDPTARGIYVVQLAPALNETVGPHVRVLSPSPDESLIEAPWLFKHGDDYHLLFSANGADTAEYRVGDATSSSPFGPFTRRGLVITKNWWVPGPGHCSVVASPDGTERFIVYHAKTGWDVSWDREVCIDRLAFDESSGGMHAFGPTRDPQPMPAGVNGSAGAVHVDNAGFEGPGLHGWSVDMSRDAVAYSALVTHPITARQARGQECAYQGQHMLWFWSLVSFSGAIRQEVTGLTANATYRLVAWGGSSNRRLEITAVAGGQALSAVTIDPVTISRASLVFTLPTGETTITITISSPAGGTSSWAWVDAVQVYRAPT